MILKFLVLTFFISTSWALPESFEIWFISSSDQNTTQFFPELEQKVLFSKSYAQAFKCIPMGEFCFDPQVGLYKKDGMGTGDFNAAPDIEDIESDKNPIPTASSLDRSLINCEKDKNMFDIYCGKAKGDDVSSSSKFQVWIDTSSSMRKVDDNNKSNTCKRKLFVENLRGVCPRNIDLSFEVFNTRKKQLGGIDDACLNVGLNDAKRMIEWIKRSQAKKLVIITDIFELDAKLTNFVVQNGGRLRGHRNGEALDANAMVAMATDVAKSCQKK